MKEFLYTIGAFALIALIGIAGIVDQMNTPAVGQVWVAHNPESNPFLPENYATNGIVEIKDGWVKYHRKINGSWDQTDRCVEIYDFVMFSTNQK